MIISHHYLLCIFITPRRTSVPVIAFFSSLQAFKYNSSLLNDSKYLLYDIRIQFCSDFGYKWDEKDILRFSIRKLQIAANIMIFPNIFQVCFKFSIFYYISFTYPMSLISFQSSNKLKAKPELLLACIIIQILPLSNLCHNYSFMKKILPYPTLKVLIKFDKKL